MKRSPSITFFSLALAVILVPGCSKPARPPAVAPVLTAKAIVTNVPVDIQPQPVGHVVAFSSAAVRPQIGGVLQRISFQEGAEVKSNQLLFTIDPRTAQAALSRDQAQLENAQIQFAREQKLFDQKLISQDEFDTSRANRDTLAATVDSDKLNLNYTEIRAPFDGIAGRVQIHEGNVVKATDDVLLTINRIHPIYVQFAVPERYLSEIKKQMASHTLAVAASYENLAGDPPRGQLVFVDNSVDPMTGTIQLKAVFSNENNVLWPGQFVKVNLTLSEIKDAIVAPAQALQTGQNGPFVYVVKPDETVEIRPVTATINAEGYIVIEKGLNAGETVVTDGQLRLFPGAKVNVKSDAMSAVSGDRTP
jgi:membrane fusion protein, multidrug efflux system